MRIVAIGGGASVGKSTCARQIADLLCLPEIVHVDDLSKRLQAEGCPHPLDVIRRPWLEAPRYLCELLIDWTALLHPLILGEVDRLAATGGVIEGEGVDPRIAPDLAAVGVKCVYVVESDRGRLRETFSSRPSSPTFLGLSNVEQKAVVETNCLYGEWLRCGAREAGQPWVSSQPWETLAGRVLEQLP